MPEASNTVTEQERPHRFIAAARKAACSDDEVAFDEAVKKVARPKLKDEPRK